MKILVSIIFLVMTNLLFSQAIQTEVKKTVGFIYAKDKLGKVSPQGTGFFVSVSDTINGEIKGALYFVTAKHVLKQGNTYRDTILIRLNKKDSLSEYGRVELFPKGKNKNIFIHPDSTVDIAVLPIMPDPYKFDYITLPSTYLTNKKSFKELNISEGSDVFFTGLFTPFIGNKKIYPIVRFGRVALITEEKIPWGSEMTSLYLMETSSYGGNSGSPVFFYLGVDRGGGGLFMGKPQLKLAGIMKGYFGENTPIKIIETQKTPVSNRNLGIAAVVPSYLLEEILLGNELKKIRGF